MQTPSFSIQLTQLGPTWHGTSTKHQFPYLNPETDSNIQMFIQETSCTHEEVLLSLLLLKDIAKQKNRINNYLLTTTVSKIEKKKKTRI